MSIYWTPPTFAKTAPKATRRSKAKSTLMVTTTFAALMGFAIAETGLLSPSPALAKETISNISSRGSVIEAYPSFADLVEDVRPAVVSIRTKGHAKRQTSRFDQESEAFPQGHPFRDFFEQFGERGPKSFRRQERPQKRRMGQGSGFFISADGYAVTNNHVISGAETVTLVMSDGTELEADVIGRDDKTDLALIKVERKEDFDFVKFADNDIRVGDWVVAVGNPFGLGGTVTAGIVSARGRDIGATRYDDFIQIDASINRGNSGGPTFNRSGEVVGVNTAIFSPSGGSVGIGFAIPADTVKAIVADLKDDGKVVRGWLGVQIQPVSKDIADSLGLENTHGALVVEVQSDSPAEEAGLKAGDTVLAVDGDEVKSPKSLSRLVARIAPGTRSDLKIWRNGKEQALTVKLGTLPITKAALQQSDDNQGEEATVADLGIKLAPGASRGTDEKGATIVDVDPLSPASEKGLRAGDVIVSANGNEVNTPGDVAEVIAQIQEDGRGTVLLKVRSPRGLRFLALPLKKG